MNVPDAFYKQITITLLAMMLGAAGDWFLRGKDVATRADLIPINTSLAAIAATQVVNADEITSLKIEVGKITEHNLLEDNARK